MIRLIGTELYKLWMKKSFLVVVFLLAVANVFFLWHDNAGESGEIPASAYRKMTENMSGMTMEEKDDYLKRCKNRLQIIASEGVSEESLIFTNDVNSESRFLSEIQKEFEEVNGYGEFLESVLNKADQLSQISIFQSDDDETSYNQKCIDMDKETYSKLTDIETDYEPQKGLMTALSFDFTDKILLIFMMFLSFVLIYDEKNQGLLRLIGVTPGGRVKTGAAKFAAQSLSLAFMVCMLYGVNLGICARLYGLGDLSRSLQSVPDLMHSTWQISVTGYLGLFLLAKCAAAIIIGLLTALMVLWLQHMISGFLAVFAFLAVGELAYHHISAVSSIGAIKYLNLSALADTNDLLGTPQFLNFFDHPFRKAGVEAVLAMILFVLLLTLFMVKFRTCAEHKRNSGKLLRVKWDAYLGRPWTRLFHFEIYKHMALLGGLAVSLVYLGMTAYQTHAASYYVGTQEYYFRQYTQAVEGRFTEEKYETLLKLSEDFDVLYALETAYDQGAVSADTYASAEAAYGNLALQKKIFEEVIEDRIGYLETRPDAQIVYESGYRLLFDLDDLNDLSQMLYLFVFVIVSCCGIFALEKQTGMSSVVLTTPLGRRKTFCKKLGTAAVISILYSGISLIPMIVWAMRDYGIANFNAPLQSIHVYGSVPAWIKIWMLMAFLYLCRCLCVFVVSVLTCWLSQRFEHMVTAAFMSLVLMCLFPFLALFGIDEMSWMSMYPLFHLASMSVKGDVYRISWLYLPVVTAFVTVLAADLRRLFVQER